MNEFQTIVKDICDELNIKMDVISNGWVTILEKDNQRKLIAGCHFDLNTHALGCIIDDKYATYTLLEKIGVPVCHHEIVYSPNNKNEFAKNSNTHKYVYKYFFKNKQNIVLKANRGAMGKQVLHITKEEEIKSALDQLFANSYSVSVCPYYNIKNEYRIIVLDGNIELMYKKIKPIVIGDGQSTLKELLIKFNKHYFHNNELLKEFDYEKILAKDEIFEYNWQFNLSSGATATIKIDAKDKKELLEIVNKIINNLNLSFASIDIIELQNGEKMVLEINSGVSLAHYAQIEKNGYVIAKNIYKKAIMKMFNL